MVDVRAYAAGASLVRPMVMKNSDRSWKQLSRTLSTVRRRSLAHGSLVDRHGREAATHTFILTFVLPLPCFIESAHLVDSFVVEHDDILAADVFRSVLLEKQ